MKFLNRPSGVAENSLGIRTIAALKLGNYGIVRIQGQIQDRCKVQIESQIGQRLCDQRGVGSGGCFLL